MSWAQIWAGTLRLGLVVAAPHGSADITRALTGVARAIPDASTFREDVMTPGRHDGRLRERLRYLEDAVKEATGSNDADTVRSLTWKLLFSLYVQTVELQGDVARGRTACIGELQRRDAPHRLDAVVEWPVPNKAAADADPGLLLELAEAYYIENGGRGVTTSPMDWGIRGHTSSGPGFPFADRHFGPFWLLLQTRPRETVALINRMLNHAGLIEDRVAGRCRPQHRAARIREPSAGRRRATLALVPRCLWRQPLYQRPSRPRGASRLVASVRCDDRRCAQPRAGGLPQHGDGLLGRRVLDDATSTS